MQLDTRVDGSIIAVIGVSRSGKSVLVKRAAEKDQRVLAFDPKGEMCTQFGYERITTGDQLLKRCKELGEAPAKLAFIASDSKSFDLFCGVAFNWNLYAPITVICEELARVTNPAKAKGNWGRLTNQGLAYGIVIYGTVQRGQEVDKTLINNSTFVHVCRHNTDNDAKYMADLLGIPVEKIPRVPREFIQWTSDRGVVVEGVIDFPASGKTQNWKEGVPRFRTKVGRRNVLKLIGGGKFQGIQYHYIPQKIGKV